MSESPHRCRLWFVCVLVANVLLACSPRQIILTPSLTTISSHGTVQPLVTLAPALTNKTPSESTISPVRSFPTGTVVSVSVTAKTGSIFIRRGPDPAFNPISVLKQGQQVTAAARNVLGTWLQIPLPGNSIRTGWISITTIYTIVSGDVRSLPEIQPTEWPILAFLRNCTNHQLILDPSGMDIPPIDSFPYNEVRVNPGTYTVIDTDVDSYPEVMVVDIREGTAIDIRIDGNGEKRKCPLP